MANPTVNRPQGLLDRLWSGGYGVERQGEWSEQIRNEEGEMADRLVRIAELMAAGTRPNDPAVLDEVEWYYRQANQYGGVNAATFTAIGDALVDNEQTRAVFDDVAEELAAYHREAITAYVQARLSEGGA
ncbi:TipAS antibiotic-recognition domain-containing protein [Kribbella swartbergensis]